MISARWRFAGTVAIVAAFVGAWYLTLAPASIGGPLTPVLVRGVSMEPTYHAGDLVLCFRRGAPAPGEIVAFRVPTGQLVIHRVVSLDGDRVRTRGDNVAHEDPWPTTTADVAGRARLRIPGVGQLMARLRQPVALAAMSGLLGFWLVLGAPEEWFAAERPRTRGLRRARPGVSRVLLVAGLALALGVRPSGGLAASLTVAAGQIGAWRVPAATTPTYPITPAPGCNPRRPRCP